VGVAISGLVAATTIAEADVFEIEQSSTSKKITKTQLRKLLYTDPALSITQPITGDSLVFSGTDWAAGARGGWRTVPVEAYTEAAAASTSTITFAGGGPTNGIKLKGGDYFAVGSPVRVEIGASTYYYGICTAVTDTLLSMSGMIMPLTAISSLAVGTREMIKRVDLMYADVTYNTLGAAVALGKGCQHRWRGATGYLVAASVGHTNTSATTQVNFKMNAGTNVLTTSIIPAAGGGATSAGAFTDAANGQIIAANAVIADSQTITVVVPVAGGTADYLNACLTFIVP
jgi:hypothetical protein